VQGIPEKSQTTSARQAKVAIVGLQANSTDDVDGALSGVVRNSNATQPMR